MSDLIKITQWDSGAPPSSRIFDSACAYGTPLGAHGSDSTKFDLAGPNSYLGHVTRTVELAADANAAIPARELFGVPGTTEVGFETPFRAGGQVTVKKARKFEAEGAGFVLSSGTGSINGATAINTAVSFQNGKVRVKQANDVNNGFISAQLTPDDSTNPCAIEVTLY